MVFAPNVSADSIDPDDIQANPLNEDFAESLLDEQSSKDNFTSDRDFTTAFNLSRALGASFAEHLQARRQVPRQGQAARELHPRLRPDDDFPLTSFTDPDFDPATTIIDGRYVMGPFVGSAQGR